MIKFYLTAIYCYLFFAKTLLAQSYWQQKIQYDMTINFNHVSHQFEGNQKIKYFNNSPDDLKKVYMHLYYNAFQPGSMMDVRSMTIEDPDSRVLDRINKLKDNEIGFHKIKSVTNSKGEKIKFIEDGTILEIILNKPLKAGKSLDLELSFMSQVPVQIRRTGRYNKENVAYSMTQWYPKMCEYDIDGWHTNPYIGREFHGVWGDFKVTIEIDSSFILGGTGIIQNPQTVGHGYEDKNKPLKKISGSKINWVFKAENVHDFAWAADPFFVHDTTKLKNGTIIHFLHKNDRWGDNWSKLKPNAVKIFDYMNLNYGKYPYKQYSIIQGGDGGMEYPMCTLITSEGSLDDLISVTAHEAIHSWFQGLLATNEAKYEWMDEGFCTYAQYEVLNYLKNKQVLNHLSRQYRSYIRLANSEFQEPLSTHADFYKLNYTYGVSAYNKGAVFLHQLGYIIGNKVLKKVIKRYFEEWKFKHPRPIDFKRIAEKESGLELDWYFEQFVETINTIDYSIDKVEDFDSKTKISIKRIGAMPMPIDICVKFTDSTVSWYTIPLRIMRGCKNNDIIGSDFKVLSDWPWVYENYEFLIDFSMDKVEEISIDPSTRLADVNSSNNIWIKNKISEEGKFIYKNKVEY